MAFNKITNEDRQGLGNVGQPDTPLLTTTEMQEQMDSLPNLAIDKFNDFIDAISAPTAASNIGCTVPSGFVANNNLFAILDAIALMTRQCNDQKHSHSNKTLLDTLSADTFTEINDLIALFGSITAVENTVSDSPAKLPTSLAVKTYVDTADIKTKIRDSVYPVGAVYVTTLQDPDTLFGTSGKWQLLKTEDGIKFYKRLS